MLVRSRRGFLFKVFDLVPVKFTLSETRSKLFKTYFSYIKFGLCESFPKLRWRKRSNPLLGLSNSFPSTRDPASSDTELRQAGRLRMTSHIQSGRNSCHTSNLIIVMEPGSVIYYWWSGLRTLIFFTYKIEPTRCFSLKPQMSRFIGLWTHKFV